MIPLELMRKLLIAVLVLLASAAAGIAQTVGNLQAQFGNKQGFSQGSGLAQCANRNALPYLQCVNLTNLKALYGTVTVKRPNVEILLSLKCNSSPSKEGAVQVLALEMFQGTKFVSAPWFPSGIDCAFLWADWQEINNNFTVINNGDFEYQITGY